MPYPDKDEREEQDKAMQERIKESTTCPNCNNGKLAHRKHCWLCTDVSIEDDGK